MKSVSHQVGVGQYFPLVAELVDMKQVYGYLLGHQPMRITKKKKKITMLI